MEDQGQGQIECILDRSLDNLSAEDDMDLRRTSECSLVLDKISLVEYLNWLDKAGDDIRGVEYDAQNFSVKYENRLSAATGSDYILTGSIDCLLVDEYDGSIKQADASLMELEAEWPAVVLEVGISETIEKLYEDVNRWLDGRDGNTKIVILIGV